MNEHKHIRHETPAGGHANGNGAMHSRHAGHDLAEEIVDVNTTIKGLSSILDSKDSEGHEVITALKRLGELANPKAVLELDRFLEEQEKDGEGRRKEAIPHALIALGKTEDKSMSTRIIRWMHSKDPEVRAAVATAVGYLDDKECMKAVADMLKDPDERVRLASVRTLGIMGDDTVLLSICNLAGDPVSDIRAESAKSTAAILKRDLRHDVPDERLQKLLVVTKKVKDSFEKLKNTERISLVREEFDGCVRDLNDIILTHKISDARGAVERAQTEIEKLIKENARINAEADGLRADTRKKLNFADEQIGELADENYQLKREMKGLEEQASKMSSDAQDAHRIKQENKELKKQLEDAVVSKGDLMSRHMDLKGKATETEALRAENEKLKSENEKFKSENEKFKSENEKFKSENEKFKSDNEKLKSETGNLEAEAEGLRVEVEGLRIENEKLKSEIAGLKSRTENKGKSNETVVEMAEVLKSAVTEEERRNFNDEIRKLKESIDKSAERRKKMTLPYKIGVGVMSLMIIAEGMMIYRGMTNKPKDVGSQPVPQVQLNAAVKERDGLKAELEKLQGEKTQLAQVVQEKENMAAELENERKGKQEAQKKLEALEKKLGVFNENQKYLGMIKDLERQMDKIKSKDTMAGMVAVFGKDNEHIGHFNKCVGAFDRSTMQAYGPKRAYERKEAFFKAAEKAQQWGDDALKASKEAFDRGSSIY